MFMFRLRSGSGGPGQQQVDLPPGAGPLVQCLHDGLKSLDQHVAHPCILARASGGFLAPQGTLCQISRLRMERVHLLQSGPIPGVRLFDSLAQHRPASVGSLIEIIELIPTFCECRLSSVEFLLGEPHSNRQWGGLAGAPPLLFCPVPRFAGRGQCCRGVVLALGCQLLNRPTLPHPSLSEFLRGGLLRLAILIFAFLSLGLHGEVLFRIGAILIAVPVAVTRNFLICPSPPPRGRISILLQGTEPVVSLSQRRALRRGLAGNRRVPQARLHRRLRVRFTSHSGASLPPRRLHGGGSPSARRKRG